MEKLKMRIAWRNWTILTHTLGTIFISFKAQEMKEGGAHFWKHIFTKTKNIPREDRYILSEGAEENGWVMSERGRKMKKDVWSTLYWPFRVFCCCICQQTISKAPHTIFSFLAWYIDISVVRWLGKCSRNTVEDPSIYFFSWLRA